eukprot:scaffold279_cov229-Pinguiococcus_pyrenoidosus.AAC.3
MSTWIPAGIELSPVAMESWHLRSSASEKCCCSTARKSLQCSHDCGGRGMALPSFRHGRASTKIRAATSRGAIGRNGLVATRSRAKEVLATMRYIASSPRA